MRGISIVFKNSKQEEREVYFSNEQILEHLYDFAYDSWILCGIILMEF